VTIRVGDHTIYPPNQHGWVSATGLNGGTIETQSVEAIMLYGILKLLDEGSRQRAAELLPKSGDTR
jgi:hypothetical protein